MLFLLPDFVRKVLTTLHQAGYEAYVVGGCVRDLCRQKSPQDYDITTNARPQQVSALFSRCIATGIAHGTVTVISDGLPIEVTTYRTEGSYSDSRHPDGVRFVGDLAADLARRDFTVNAMAYDGADLLVDLFGGKEDLAAGILRAVGNPQRRFSEDALRILRLYRFAAVLGFTAEEKTAQAALQAAGSLEKISRERIAGELRRAFCGDFPERLLPLLTTNALSFAGLHADSRLAALKKIPADVDLRMAAGLTLCGSHPLECANALRLANREKELTAALLPPPDADLTDRAAVKQLLRTYGERQLKARISYYKALDLPAADETVMTDILQSGEAFTVRQLHINGEDLLHCGFAGAAIGATLNHLCDAVIKNPALNNRPDLLRLADTFWQ